MCWLSYPQALPLSLERIVYIWLWAPNTAAVIPGHSTWQWYHMWKWHQVWQKVRELFSSAAHSPFGAGVPWGMDVCSTTQAKRQPHPHAYVPVVQAPTHARMSRHTHYTHNYNYTSSTHIITKALNAIMYADCHPQREIPKVIPWSGDWWYLNAQANCSWPVQYAPPSHTWPPNEPQCCKENLLGQTGFSRQPPAIQ